MKDLPLQPLRATEIPYVMRRLGVRRSDMIRLVGQDYTRHFVDTEGFVAQEAFTRWFCTRAARRQIHADTLGVRGMRRVAATIKLQAAFRGSVARARQRNLSDKTRRSHQ